MSGSDLWKPGDLLTPRKRAFDLPEIRIAPRLERIPGPTRHRPPCVDKVKVSALETNTRRFREEKTRRAGVPIDQCAEPATFRYDGVDLCTAHAGLRALKWLMGET